MATHCRAVFARCDVLATPTLPIAPPRLADEGCVSHMAVVGQCMKYVQLGNFMSLPAVSVPCGLDASNLPVGCAAAPVHCLCRPRSCCATVYLFHVRAAGPLECHASCRRVDNDSVLIWPLVGRKRMYVAVDYE